MRASKDALFLCFCIAMNKSRLPVLLRISYGENNYKIKRSEPLKNCAV